MKRYVAAAIAAIFTCLSVTTQANAANLSTPNYSVYEVNSGSVIVPWNADWTVEISGASGQGESRNAVALQKTMWLSKDTKLSWNCGRAAAYNPNGCTYAAGEKSQFYVNDSLWITAAGGCGLQPSYNQSDKTITECWYTSAGSEGGTDGEVGYHTCSNKTSPCYTGCDGYLEYKADITWTSGVHILHPNVCKKCGARLEWLCQDNYGCIGPPPDEGWFAGYFGQACYSDDRTKIKDGHHNTLKHICGHNSGDVLSVTYPRIGNSYNPHSFSITTPSSDSGYVNIKLANTFRLKYRNVTVQLPYYLNSKVKLGILEDTVFYYKR